MELDQGIESCKAEADESAHLLETQRRRKKRPGRLRKAMVLLACVMQHFICNGVGFGLSVMYAELIIVFQAKRSEAALIQSLYMGTATGAGIIFTSLIKRFGPGFTIIFGTMISCSGLFASGYADDILTIIICTGVLAGSGMCLCYLAAYLSITWTFHEDPGFFLVCLTIGSSLAQLAAPLLFDFLITEYFWSGAFIIVSAVALHCIPFGIVINFSKEYYVTNTDKFQSERKQASRCDLSLLKDGVIWILLLNFHLIALTGMVEPLFIVDLMVSRGFTRQTGSLLVSVIGVANLFGRLLGGVLRLRFRNVATLNHWIYLCPVIGVCHALVVSLHDFGMIVAVCFVYGVTFGATIAQTPTIMFEASGLDRYPQGIAMVNLMYGCGDVFAGLLGGYIKDSLGEYDVAFYVSTGTSVYIALATLVAARLMGKRRNESPPCNGVKFTKLRS